MSTNIPTEKVEIPKWNKSKRKKRGTAIRSQRILAQVMELVADGHDKESIVIMTGLNPFTYDYYINKINQMYLQRYKETTEQKLGIMLGLAQRRLEEILKFCQKTLRSKDENTYYKIKAAELYREVIKDSTKLQVSSKKIIEDYSKMTELKDISWHYKEQPKLTYIDENTSLPTNEGGLNGGDTTEGGNVRNDSSTAQGGSEGSESVRDPERVF